MNSAFRFVLARSFLFSYGIFFHDKTLVSSTKPRFDAGSLATNSHSGRTEASVHTALLNIVNAKQTRFLPVVVPGVTCTRLANRRGAVRARLPASRGPVVPYSMRTSRTTSQRARKVQGREEWARSLRLVFLSRDGSPSHAIE